MKNQYLSHYKLPSLSNLLSTKVTSINLLVNNLKFKDVKEDIDFEQSKQKIKKSILVDPIILGEPKLIDYSYSVRNVPREQLMVGLVSKDQYIYEIEFPFTGDSQLFQHSPDTMTFLSSDHGVISPQIGKITVYVDLGELNPAKAINEAKSLLRLTTDIGERNSATIISWNSAVEKRIDSDLEDKRTELFKLFGKL